MEPNKAYGMHNAPGNKNVRVQLPVYPNEAYSVCKGGTHEDPEYELVNQTTTVFEDLVLLAIQLALFHVILLGFYQ